MRRRLSNIAAGFVFLGGLFWAPAASRAADLIVYTESYPPFNFEGESGSVEGLATEKVRQVLDAAGIGYEIRLVPWARAVNYTHVQDNALIFSITRTPRRERSFDWLVPLAEANFYLFARAGDMRTVTPEALKAGKFTASCVSSDLACELLTWAGIPVGNIIPIPESGTGDFRMVMAGRADLYISDIAVNRRLRTLEGFSPASTKPVLKLEGQHGFYLASGLKVPSGVREKIRAAYDKLVADGTYRPLGYAELR